MPRHCNHQQRISRARKLILAAFASAVALAGCSMPESGGKIAISPTPVLTSNVQDSLDAFKGKVVILDFWATWCGPCRMEIPGFIKLQEKYRDKGLEVIGVSIDPIATQGGGAPAVGPFIKSNGINYTIWMVNSADAMRGYDVSRGIPTTYVIDRKGGIVRTYVGARTQQVFENDITSLL